jgi:hypothetical protein
MKYLFIGGCADGTWREVSGRLPHVKVKKPLILTPIRDYTDEELKCDFYERSEWSVGDLDQDKRTLYALERMGPSEIWEKLTTGYKKGKEAEQ